MNKTEQVQGSLKNEAETIQSYSLKEALRDAAKTAVITTTAFSTLLTCMIISTTEQ